MHVLSVYSKAYVRNGKVIMSVFHECYNRPYTVIYLVFNFLFFYFMFLNNKMNSEKKLNIIPLKSSAFPSSCSQIFCGKTKIYGVCFIHWDMHIYRSEISSFKIYSSITKFGRLYTQRLLKSHRQTC